MRIHPSEMQYSMTLVFSFPLNLMPTPRPSRASSKYSLRGSSERRSGGVSEASAIMAPYPRAPSPVNAKCRAAKSNVKETLLAWLPHDRDRIKRSSRHERQGPLDLPAEQAEARTARARASVPSRRHTRLFQAEDSGGGQSAASRHQCSRGGNPPADNGPRSGDWR